MAEEWSYEAVEVAPDQFGTRVREMIGEGFAGANVTVPYKSTAMLFAHRKSEVAREIGAANTLSFEDGAIRADNTDAEGLMEALPGSPAGRRALVLGAGGAARAVVWALVQARAEVSVWNRTPELAAELCAELGGREERDPTAGEYELIVNATSVGLAGEDPFAELPLKREMFAADQAVVDLVYGDAESALLKVAADAGAETIDGLEVLVHQGAASFRIWTGVDPPLETMREAARAT